MMKPSSPTASQKVADEVVTALGHLAATANAGADLEAGEAADSTSVTDTLVTAVAKSVISKVDTETSLSLLRRGATWCWGKLRASMTRQNLTATFGACPTHSKPYAPRIKACIAPLDATRHPPDRCPRHAL